MKKIFILVDQFYKHGGIEKLVSIKANYWSDVYNYRVTIISTENKNNKKIYKLNSKVIFNDLNIKYNRTISYFSIYNLVKLLLNIYKIQLLILRKKPDYIIVASHIPITYVLPFLFKPKTRLIKEIHFTNYYRASKTSKKSKLLNSILGLYDKIVVLSNEEKKLLKSKNSIIIPNPIYNKFKIKPIDINKRNNVVVSILRFAPVKRIELFVNIWKKVIVNDPNWELHIYGDYNNDYGKKIINLINDNNLNSYIKLKGKTNTPYKVLSKSKISMLVSEQECFPMLILESFATGVPSIAFDCPTGPRNIIEHNINGILIQNNNINEFAQKLIKFINNNEFQKKLSKEAYSTSKEYSINKIMKLWNTKIFNQ